MKKFKLSIVEIIVLIIFLSYTNPEMIWNFIESFINLILFSNNFSNPYNFSKFLANQSTNLSTVSYINKFLLLIAGFIPSLILKFILQGENIPNWLKWIFCIALYYVVLQLFSCTLFWIIIALIFSCILTKILIDYFKNKRRT